MIQEHCPVCDLLLAAHTMDKHINGERCKARIAARQVRARGFIPVEMQHRDSTAYVNGVSKHYDEALALFDLPHELHPTRAGREMPFRGSGRGDQCWTTEDGVALLQVINAAARLLGLSFPEATRRLHMNQKLIASFDSARRLGAPVERLIEMLSPIDYVIGSDGKKRRRPR